MRRPVSNRAAVLITIAVIAALVGVGVAYDLLQGDGRHAVEILDVAVSDDGLLLTVTTRSCHPQSVEIDVVETPREVRLRATALPSDEDCLDGTTIELSEPLDGREIVRQ